MPDPERLGRYTLSERIGQGGMGVVFRGELAGAEGFSKQVAIKRIHGSLARDPGIRDAFVAEALTAQRLQHGNIAQLIDVGVADDADGAPYLVIEHVDGASLAELLRGPPLPTAAALHIAESVAAALAYAHGLSDAAGRPEGVVHRDVTPRNILVSRDGVVKLVDFGIAKALSSPSFTLPGTCKGSLGYMAPEQARGEPTDARADQFSLGIVLYEMLAGRNPLASRDVEGYLRAIAAPIPPLPGDADLAAILARATALEPAARYASMDELRSELEAWRVAHKLRTSADALREAVRERLAAGATAPAAAPRPLPLGDALAAQLPPAIATQRAAPPTPRRASRRSLAFAIAGLAILAAGFVFFQRSRSRSEPPPAAPPSALQNDALRPPYIGSAAAPPTPATGQATPATGQAPAPPPLSGSAAAPAPAATPAPPTTATRPAPRKPGRLKVMVVPWATVLLDDRPLGGVPLDLEVPAGRHRVTLHNPDTGDRVEKSIEVQPGGLAEVTSW